MTDGQDPAAPELRRTYDRIAPHFASTREYPWPEVERFLEGRAGSRGIDIGCGNGRHAELLAGKVDLVAGVDVSSGLLQEAMARAADRGFDARFAPIVGDAAALPFPAAGFDLGLYVATLHHLRPRTRRVRSLSELARVLAPDARALVSAWSTAHDRFDDDNGFDTTIDWTLPDGTIVPRFYHIYDPTEFRADLDESALRPLDAFVSSGNCYAVVTPAGTVSDE